MALLLPLLLLFSATAPLHVAKIPEAKIPEAKGGLLRPAAPSHRPIYLKVETAPPCNDVEIGQMLLKVRPLLADCAKGGPKAQDGTFRMGSAIFQVELGGKKPKIDAGKGSLSPKVRACMVRKVLARLPVGDAGWPKQKCAVRLTIRAD